jgi:hypothetical protein
MVGRCSVEFPMLSRATNFYVVDLCTHRQSKTRESAGLCDGERGDAPSGYWRTGRPTLFKIRACLLIVGYFQSCSHASRGSVVDPVTGS